MPVIAASVGYTLLRVGAGAKYPWRIGGAL
jgi:hypothetical protein